MATRGSLNIKTSYQYRNVDYKDKMVTMLFISVACVVGLFILIGPWMGVFIFDPVTSS